MEREVSELDRKLLLKKTYLDKINYYISRNPINQEELYLLVRHFFTEYLKLDYEFTYEELSQELNKVFIKPEVKKSIDAFLIKLSESEYLEESELGTTEINSFLTDLNVIIKEVIYEDQSMQKDDDSILQKVLKMRHKDDASQDLSVINSMIDELNFHITGGHLDIAKKLYLDVMKLYDTIDRSDKKKIHDSLNDVYERLQLMMKNPGKYSQVSQVSIPASTENNISNSSSAPSASAKNVDTSYGVSSNANFNITPSITPVSNVITDFSSTDSVATSNFILDDSNKHNIYSTSASTTPLDSSKSLSAKSSTPSTVAVTASTDKFNTVSNATSGSKSSNVLFDVSSQSSKLSSSSLSAKDSSVKDAYTTSRTSNASLKSPILINEHSSELLSDPSISVSSSFIDSASSLASSTANSTFAKSLSSAPSEFALNIELDTLGNNNTNSNNTNTLLNTNNTGKTVDTGNSMDADIIFATANSTSVLDVKSTLNTKPILNTKPVLNTKSNSPSNSNVLFSVESQPSTPVQPIAIPSSKSILNIQESKLQGQKLNLTEQKLTKDRSTRDKLIKTPVSLNTNASHVSTQKISYGVISDSPPKAHSDSSSNLLYSNRLTTLLQKTSDDILLEKLDNAKKSYKEALIIYRQMSDLEKTKFYDKFNSIFKKLDDAVHQKSLKDLLDLHLSNQNKTNRFVNAGGSSIISNTASNTVDSSAVPNNHISSSADVLDTHSLFNKNVKQLPYKTESLILSKSTTLPVMLSNDEQTTRVYELIEESYFSVDNNNFDLAMLKYFKALEFYHKLPLYDKKRLYSELYELFRKLSPTKTSQTKTVQ